MREVKKDSGAKATAKKTTTKVTKAKKVKEEKVLENKTLLNKNDQKYYGILCNVVRIISKIGRICLMIFIPFLVLSMVFIPIIFKHFEVNANVLKFDNVSIILRDNGISAKLGDRVHTLNCNTIEIDKMMTFLTNNSKSSIIIHFEASVLILSTIVIVLIYLLSYIENLFTNFIKDKTPFTKENTNYIFKIAIYLVALKIACLCFSLVGVCTRCFVTVSILSILVVFVIYYVFKYATSMQEASKTKICD